MRLFHSSSTDRGKCIQCNKTSGTWAVFEQSGLKLSVPICDTHYNCMNGNKTKLTLLMTFIKRMLIDGLGAK